MPLNNKFLKLFCTTKRDFSDLKKRDQKTFINRILKIGLLYIWSSEIWSKYVKLQNFWTWIEICWTNVRVPNFGDKTKENLLNLTNWFYSTKMCLTWLGGGSVLKFYSDLGGLFYCLMSKNGVGCIFFIQNFINIG